MGSAGFLGALPWLVPSVGRLVYESGGSAVSWLASSCMQVLCTIMYCHRLLLPDRVSGPRLGALVSTCCISRQLRERRPGMAPLLIGCRSGADAMCRVSAACCTPFQRYTPAARCRCWLWCKPCPWRGSAPLWVWRCRPAARQDSTPYVPVHTRFFNLAAAELPYRAEPLCRLPTALLWLATGSNVNRGSMTGLGPYRIFAITSMNHTQWLHGAWLELGARRQLHCWGLSNSCALLWASWATYLQVRMFGRSHIR